MSGAKWGLSEASRKYSDSWHPHTGLPCRVSRGCPLSPQHWQQHLTWACPTGASFTSPSHCEYWPRLATSLQASALCLSCWLSACLAAWPIAQPRHRPLGPALLSQPRPDAQQLSRNSSASFLSRVQRGCCACLPGGLGKPRAQTKRRQPWQGRKGSAHRCTEGRHKLVLISNFVLQRAQPLPSLFLLLPSFLPHSGLH